MAVRKLPSNLTADVWRHLRNRDSAHARTSAETPIRVTNLDDGTTRVDLFDEIGFFGVTAQDFVDELLDIDAETIELHVNSPGGDVFDGVAIMNALADHPATVNVVVDGLAASAASFIAMAGDSVKMNRGSQLMIHDAAGMCFGNAAEMESMRALLDRISDTIASLYAERAGGETAGWRDLMRAETWYSAAEAVTAGLADIAGNGKDADEDEESEDEPDEDEESEGDDEDEEMPMDVAAKFTAQLSRFTYAGRAQAPTPPKTPAQAVDVSKLQAALKGAFK